MYDSQQTRLEEPRYLTLIADNSYQLKFFRKIRFT